MVKDLLICGFSPLSFPWSRLQTELMQLMMSDTPGISAFPDEGNLLQWTGTITGPDGTFYGMYYSFPFR